MVLCGLRLPVGGAAAHGPGRGGAAAGGGPLRARAAGAPRHRPGVPQQPRLQHQQAQPGAYTHTHTHTSQVPILRRGSELVFCLDL